VVCITILFFLFAAVPNLLFRYPVAWQKTNEYGGFTCFECPAFLAFKGFTAFTPKTTK